MSLEIAIRNKYRYDSAQGLLSTEDLWDLPLTSTVKGRANLDDIARDLYKKLKESDEVSFVTTKKIDESIQNKFDIVKHIIEVRVEENKNANAARENKEKKQQLYAIIAQKEAEQLYGSSLDELKKLAESM